MRHIFAICFFLTFIFCAHSLSAQQDSGAEKNNVFMISEENLRDKIRGGLLGQILGNLNGIPHEMQYIQDPGEVTNYVPALPDGARTDDDTDFEWVYILEMQRRNTLYLSPEEIAGLWKERINRRIWCSNQYARQLMDIDLVPPLTGNLLLNPWAEFNISGQFLCETFGLLGPAMPQTASRIGLNYTRVAIDGEPAQTTQLFNTMIATAFVTKKLEVILEAGLAAVDPKSRLHKIIRDVQKWHRAYPKDWKRTRRELRDAYSQVGGAMRDRNGYELNTAATIAALLYGNGDFAATLQHAFNFGWDCDNTAATAGTILGVTKGYRWMLAQGWQIVDRYKNTTRQNMPDNETITSFADRLIDLAQKVILDQGGQQKSSNGRVFFLIPKETPAPVTPFFDGVGLQRQMVTAHRENIRSDVMANDLKTKARGAYMAICFGLAEELKASHPEYWPEALEALQGTEQVIQVLFHHSPVPAAESLREKVLQAGVVAPPEKRKLWE